jgi:hypothetical protein
MKKVERSLKVEQEIDIYGFNKVLVGLNKWAGKVLAYSSFDGKLLWTSSYLLAN